jgi:hypothetical protein
LIPALIDYPLIVDLLRERGQDPKCCLEEFKKWANNRVERLKKEGWKKAQQG